MRSDAVVLEATNLGVGYGAAPVLRDVSLALRAGEMAALLGRNGAGKSTLIRLLSGVLSPERGDLSLDGRPLAGMNRREIARRIAVVPQELQVPFAFTTREVVAMGRTAHIPFLQGEAAADRDAVEHALRRLDIVGLAERPFNTLSGGERQRGVLALALAQEPSVLLLDEPTVHLDLAHQVEVLRLVRDLNHDAGLTVLAAIHDLNLAALFFERLLMLKDGRIAADGPPHAVLTAEIIGDVFGAEVLIYRHPTADVPQMMHCL